jgi:DNA-binding transcriptional LysR family regulator
MLNLNQLAQFLRIARTGSVTAAAEELGLSAAALSKSLAALERQLGTKLFDRVGRGLQLTRVGQRLVDQAAELLGHVDRLRADLRTSTDGSGGTLAVGCGPAALQGPVGTLVRELVEAPPRVRLHIESGSTTNLLEKLRQYQLDFVVADVSRLTVSPDLTDYRVLQLPAAPMQLVVSEAHPLRTGRTITLEQALQYPWVTPSIPLGMREALGRKLSRDGAPESAFARLAALPDVQIEDLSACLHVAAQSLCIAATLTTRSTDGGRTRLPSSLKALSLDVGLTTQIGIITLKTRTPSPLAARAMSLLTRCG